MQPVFRIISDFRDLVNKVSDVVWRVSGKNNHFPPLIDLYLIGHQTKPLLMESIYVEILFSRGQGIPGVTLSGITVYYMFLKYLQKIR